MKRFFIFLLMAVLIIQPIHGSIASQGFRLSIPSISSGACIVTSAKGDSVYEKNADMRLHPASTTKILTAILAIEKGGLNKKYKVSRAAIKNIGIGGSNAGLKLNEEVKMMDLLHMLMICSANDAANVIAEGTYGNSFVKQMNKRARELGAKNTTFYNPSGLDVEDGFPNHKTTARDLAILTKYAMSLPLFREIVAKKTYRVPPTNKSKAREIKNTNKFLSTYPYSKDLYTIIGVKTGGTKAAKNNLVVAARDKKGNELICVLLNNPQRQSLYADAKRIFDNAFVLQVQASKSPPKTKEERPAAKLGKEPVKTAEAPEPPVMEAEKEESHEEPLPEIEIGPGGEENLCIPDE